MTCFVRPDTRIPFMAMPDGVDALVQLASAPRERLTRTAYNVAAFNPSADEIPIVVVQAFPSARIDWDVDDKRQGIVDSWPADVDDSAARRDWGFAPRYDFHRAFHEYLVPTIRRQYAKRCRFPVTSFAGLKPRERVRARCDREPRTAIQSYLSVICGSLHSTGGVMNGSGVPPGSGRPLPSSRLMARTVMS